MGTRASLRHRASPNSQILRSILRAYVLAYLTTTGPRLLSFLRILRRKDLNAEEKALHLLHTLRSGLRWNRFPTFCALLMGGSTILPALIVRLQKRILVSRSTASRGAIRFLAVLLSAWLCFPILNRKYLQSTSQAAATQKSQEIGQIKSSSSDGRSHPETQVIPDLAGRTLDLSLFALVRAADVLACIAWDKWKGYRKSKHSWTPLESIAPNLGDSGMFAASAAVVMWAWFYLPERLPCSYGKWIGEVAQVDSRLIEALRSARRGEWKYGQPSPKQPPLTLMCEDYGWPQEWGDPSKTVPIPCEMVHMGCGPSCEKHALWRFAKAFKFACTGYLPLALALRWRSRSLSAFLDAAKNSIRSSAFLGLFVSIFYYSVCLSRTRLGPKIFSKNKVTPMMWDSGLCVAAGCMMCGWSIFVENMKRRREIALFVAPRAAATLLPRRYNRKYLWREQAAFAVSTAIVLTCIQERPDMVRGVLGKVLSQVVH
ncbi:hypothetical protein AJ80_02414 [Polytolypa hystricis UAMH7299]|uniref:Integral membrane protein n=1 Tax=Polytolypa hystricis (strain UAMH7299) TaxID=1447883 RepID=A0A2B7YQX9_POLH7|nr:hypothetical protein AJ80_02414 [Polytolypa hystricis UAMH7299]